MNTLMTFKYLDNNITFKKGDITMVNAAEMAKPFGKRTTDFLRTANTNEFINKLSEVRKCVPSDLVQVIYGDGGGTWMQEDVALEFARWLSPKFAIWCNDRIKELLTTGSVSVESITRKDMAKMVLQAEEEIERLQLQVESQSKELVSAKPKVEFYDKVLSSENGIAISVIASDLGCSARRLNETLHKLGIQYKIDDTWMLYANFKGKGYTVNKTFTFENSKGELISRVTMFWTQKGREFIHYALHRAGITFKKKISKMPSSENLN